MDWSRRPGDRFVPGSFALFSEKVLLVGSATAHVEALGRALETADIALTTAGPDSIARCAESGPFAVGIVFSETGVDEAADALRRFEERSPSTACIALLPEESLPALSLFEFGNLYDVCTIPRQDVSHLARSIGRAIERRHLLRHNAYLLTELRDARDELRSQAEFLVLMEGLAAAGRLSADIASAVAAPMRAIEAYAEFMGETREAPRVPAHSNATVLARPCLDRIREAAVGCQRIVASLRSVGETPGDPEVMDARGLVEETLADLREFVEGRGIGLDPDLGDCESLALACRDELRLVLVHVVVRMADAMPGGGRLRVHLTRPTGPPECLSICFHGARDSLGSGARRLGASSQYAARSGIATPALQNLMGRFQGEIADDGGPGSEHYVNLTLRSANLDAQPPDTALVRAA